MANRTRSYYRKMRKKAINRKIKIINSYRTEHPPAFYNENGSEHEVKNTYSRISPYWCVNHKGILSKGKIHCSCGLCSFHGTTMQDRRKLASMESKVKDYYDDEYSLYVPGFQMLKSKLKKEINGVYYPNTSSFPGTTVDYHSTFDYNEFTTEVKRVSIY